MMHSKTTNDDTCNDNSQLERQRAKSSKTNTRTIQRVNEQQSHQLSGIER